jgi:hypothetical protein
MNHWQNAPDDPPDWALDILVGCILAVLLFATFKSL